MENAQDQIKDLQDKVSELIHKLRTKEIENVDGPEEVRPEVAKAYALKHSIVNAAGSLDIEAATERLKANYKAEYESVDGREMALKNTKYLRLIGPKVNGLEMREQAVHRQLQSLDSRVKSLEDLSDNIDKLQREFTDLKMKMSLSVKSMAEYHEAMLSTDSNLQVRIAALERKSKNTLMAKLKRGLDKLLCRLNLK